MEDLFIYQHTSENCALYKTITGQIIETYMISHTPYVPNPKAVKFKLVYVGKAQFVGRVQSDECLEFESKFKIFYSQIYALH